MTRLQRRTILVVILLATSLGLAGLNQAGVLGRAQSVALAPLAALQRWVSQTWNGAASSFQSSPDAEALRQRNAELEQQVAQLQRRVVELEENEADLRILSNLLDYARTQTENRYLAANVIGLDPSPFVSYIILDRGSDHGIVRDMPVVTDQGLVGRVVEVTSAACKVQLIADANAAVNALLQKSRERGVVTGKLGGGLEMQYISQQVVVQPGEKVLTSGLGGLYPPGILIGTISAVRKLDYEVLQTAELTPGVNFAQLEIVLIITNFKPVDLSPFAQSTPAAP